MRCIAIIVPAFPKLSETFIVNKFVRMLRAGWDVHVVCGTSETEEWRRFPDLWHRHDLQKRVHRHWPHRPRWLAGILLPVVFLRCLVTRPGGTLRYLVRGWPRFGARVLLKFYLDAELVALEPDLLHFEFGATAVEKMYLKELLGCKLVVSFRGYDINFAGLENRDYYAEVWRCADALHFLGKDLWHRAQRRGCPAHKPHVCIPPAIDTDFFAPVAGRSHQTVAGSAVQPLQILSVGRLEWKKGYDFALQAVKLLQDQHIHFVYHIIGDGQYFEAITFARHQLRLDDCVHLLGAQSPSQVREYLQRAEVFLHAAVTEGFCNAVLEAQAMCLPVVTSDADGLPENVVDHETGFVVPRRDPGRLAEKLILLASDPTLRQRMGTAGRARVLRDFQLVDQITAFERFYEAVLFADSRFDDDPVDEHATRTHKLVPDAT